MGLPRLTRSYIVQVDCSRHQLGQKIWRTKRTCGQAIRSQGTVGVAELVLGEEVPLTIATLKVSIVVYLQLNLHSTPPSIACQFYLVNSLTNLLTIAAADKQPLNDELASIEETVAVEDPALDFTLLGYDIELKVRYQNGDRQAFAVEELMKLFGNGDEDYTVETISTALEADHGFNPESRAIWNLLEIMAEYDAQVRGFSSPDETIRYLEDPSVASFFKVPDALCVPGMNEEALEAGSIPMLEARRMEKERREH
ncbi:hypothetical protein F5879DRAFT_1004818 [Lentinula edodes]|nr:hypothetical protein F5879DRAFT_1004818 [Lentinula edodes]